MRIAVSIAMLVFCAGCGGDETGLPPLPTDQVRARFPPGGVVDAIEVDAIDRLPLRAAELVAPDGQATAASYLHVNPTPGAVFYQRFVGAPFEGNTLGTTPLTPVSTDLTGAPQGDVRLLAMASTATIPLPDEVAYRRDWRSYRIFLSFGDVAGEVERRILPAPEPPPGSPPPPSPPVPAQQS